MTLSIEINEKLEALITSSDPKYAGRVCKLPDYNPENFVPWASQAEVRKYIERSVAPNFFKFSQIPIPPRTEPSVLSPQAFKAFFTLAERIVIAESVDVGVGIIWNDIEDPRTTSVDLGAPSTIEAIDHLATAGVITEARATELKAQ